MSERDCPDEMAVLWADREEHIRQAKLMAHPDCRDPAHPGCSQCCEYECSCDETLRPWCDGGGCAAEHANERRDERMAQDAAKWREQQARIALAIACEKACEG